MGMTPQSYREDRSPLTASGWPSTGIPGLEMSAGRYCPVALRGESRLRLTTFAKCLDILREVKSAPNTKRITGPNVVVDACPTKYSPGTDDSKFTDSRGAFPIRRSRSKIAELRNGRRCTSALYPVAARTSESREHRRNAIAYRSADARATRGYGENRSGLLR